MRKYVSLSYVMVVGLLACGPATSVPLVAPTPTLRTYPASVAPTGHQVVAGVPVRLRIPVLRIDSPTMVVGLMPDGSVGTPCDPTKPTIPCNPNATAWYKGSVRPGLPGSAVIDGHVDWYGPAGSNHDIPAVFARLDQIALGARVIVIDSQRTARTFVVDRITRLPYPRQPADAYAISGPPSLTLITCTGTFVSRSTGMSQRLYVHAVLEKN